MLLDMKTHRTLISLWPSLADFAQDLGVSENTAKQMRTRDSVHARYWLAMIAGARERGIEGVSFESLSLPVSKNEAA